MYGQNKRRGGGSGDTPAVAKKIAMMECAVVKAHSDLLAGGENVSSWSVAEAALVTLNAVSFESMGFHMQNVPSLHRLMLTEAKVNSFIHCFVGVQKITSLHDLELAICESEGVESFEDLKLGPILKHPLVVHYFSVGSDVTEVCKITTEQIVAYLSKLPRKNRKTMIDDLLDHIAKKRKKSQGDLCVRVQSLGMHIGYIIRGRRAEGNVLKKCNDGLDVKSILDDNEDEDDDGNAAKDVGNDRSNDVQDSNLFSSQNTTASDPSEAAQTQRCSEFVSPLEEKPKFCTKYAIHKAPKLLTIGMPEFQSMDVETGFLDDNAIDGHTWSFIKTWKGSCEKEENVVEVFGKMLEFYYSSMKPKRKSKAINAMISSYPHVGLLNIAIASIKFGLWDRLSSTYQSNSKEVAVSTCAAGVNTEVEPAKNNTLVGNEHVLEDSVGIALGDVLKYVKAYFVSPDYVPDNVTSYPRSQIIFLREICKLECALTRHFSVNNFETLGFGDIFTLLAEHLSLLPTTWQKCFVITEKPEKRMVKVCMSQHYLLELLSQAANSLGEMKP